MRMFALDPGSEKSGFVYLDLDTLEIFKFGKVPNSDIRLEVDLLEFDYFVTEGIQSYSSKFANTVIATTLFIGAILERVSLNAPCAKRRVFSPKTIRSIVAKTSQASDSMIREAVLDIFAKHLSIPKENLIGTKKEPGPLHGVTKDVWQALGLALAFKMTLLNEEIEQKVKELESLEGVSYK